MSNNCYVTKTDSFRLYVYSEHETVELFGEDMLAEYGHEVPKELLTRYFKNQQESKQIQNELEMYFKARE